MDPFYTSALNRYDTFVRVPLFELQRHALFLSQRDTDRDSLKGDIPCNYEKDY